MRFDKNYEIIYKLNMKSIFGRIIINPLFILLFSIITLISFIIYLYNDQRNHIDNIYFYTLIIITIISFILSIIKNIKHFKQSSNVLFIISIILIIITVFISFIISLTGNFMIYALIFSIWVYCFFIMLITSIISLVKKDIYIINYIFILSVLAVFAGIKTLEINVNYYENQLLNVAKNIKYIYDNSYEVYKIDKLNDILKKYDNIEVISFSNDYFIIRSRTRNTGSIHWLEYDSREKIINKLSHRQINNYE